jgi:hypothetical protein
MGVEAKYKLLVSHALSAWGDRMWSFSIGLYLVILSPTSLQLTAVYGLILAVSILLLGSTIGLWIDLTPRLKGEHQGRIPKNTSLLSDLNPVLGLSNSVKNNTVEYGNQNLKKYKEQEEDSYILARKKISNTIFLTSDL